MIRLSRRHMIATAAAFGLGSALPVYAKTARVSQTKAGTAIKGYDTTAYFQKSSATPGATQFSVKWQGATWQFETQADADRFQATPEAFAPQFGGYCTRAMSMKLVVDGDPEVWRIRGDRLYLFAKPVGGTVFDKDPDGMIALAQANWDKLD